MQLQNEIENKNKEFDRLVRALKAARLLKGLSRAEAAALVGWSPKAFEQLENGRCNFSRARLLKILDAYGYSEKEFARLLQDPKLAMAQVCEQKKQDHTIARRPRRNHLKIVTKEVRVIRALRMQKGFSQYEASRLCGYVPGGFGHIEAGRIELKRERIEFILLRLGYKWDDFERLMEAPILRDEIIVKAIAGLHRLDDLALESAVNVIKALIK